MVPPLPRSTPDWFGAYLLGLTSLLVSEVLGLASHQVTCLALIIAPASYFESDGLHLNLAAGLEFVKYIVAGIDQSYPVIDCGNMAPPSEADTTPSSQSELKHLATAVQELTTVTKVPGRCSYTSQAGQSCLCETERRSGFRHQQVS